MAYFCWYFSTFACLKRRNNLIPNTSNMWWILKSTIIKLLCKGDSHSLSNKENHAVYCRLGRVDFQKFSPIFLGIFETSSVELRRPLMLVSNLEMYQIIQHKFSLCVKSKDLNNESFIGFFLMFTMITNIFFFSLIIWWAYRVSHKKVYPFSSFLLKIWCQNLDQWGIPEDRLSN